MSHNVLTLGRATVVPYRGQVYRDLRKAYQDKHELFVDPLFPPVDASIFHSGKPMDGIEWKRAKDICPNPKLFVEGASSGDLLQGDLGNCWFVAASSCLATHKSLWQKMVPDRKDQEWDPSHPEKYCGIFHFQFWRYGEWIDVVVDDLLPAKNGKLVFVHSSAPNEFWSALLEKAYAKLFGSYEALDGGELCEALEDFTGGVCEPIDLQAERFSLDKIKRDELFKMLIKESSNSALMAAAIPAQSIEEMEKSTECGLVIGHAYGITAVKRVAIGGSGLFNLFNRERLAMIRLRNPWGGSEWKGAFSDGSKEWTQIDKTEQANIGLTFAEDGEFWMIFEDFCKYFTSLEICRVMGVSLFQWSKAELHGEWAEPARAGGCRQNRGTFLDNPQFVFDVTTDEDEVLLNMTQKCKVKGEITNKTTIGFIIMKVEENRQYRLHRPQEVVKTSLYMDSRSIFVRRTFTGGRYAVIPSTHAPGVTGSFLLRVYTSSNSHATELFLDKPERRMVNSVCRCLPDIGYPTCLTRVKVLRAIGLEKQEIGGADPYCTVTCEGEKVTTLVVADSLDPVWNTSAIFYRLKPATTPVIVDVWNSNPIIQDKFMGRHIFRGSERMTEQIFEVSLQDKKIGNAPRRPGRLFVEITHNPDILFL